MMLAIYRRTISVFVSGETSDERVHGLVTWTAAQDGAGKSQDAQLGDIETSWK